jgi:hypothetical protein
MDLSDRPSELTNLDVTAPTNSPTVMLGDKAGSEVESTSSLTRSSEKIATGVTSHGQDSDDLRATYTVNDLPAVTARYNTSSTTSVPLYDRTSMKETAKMFGFDDSFLYDTNESENKDSVESAYTDTSDILKTPRPSSSLIGVDPNESTTAAILDAQCTPLDNEGEEEHEEMNAAVNQDGEYAADYDLESDDSYTSESEDDELRSVLLGRRNSRQWANQLPVAADIIIPGYQNQHDLRVQHVSKRRSSRVMNHINEFIRLHITVMDNGLTDGPNLTTFPITVHKSQTIEDLAAIIEAEYAFQHDIPIFNNVKSQSHNYGKGLLSKDANTDRSKPQSSAQDTTQSGNNANLGVTTRRPLACGQLFVGAVPLRFDDIVEDVLSMDDVIHVVNMFDELAWTGNEPSVYEASHCAVAGNESLRTMTGSPFEASSDQHVSESVRPSSDLDGAPDATSTTQQKKPPTLEERFRHCLSNELALTAFQVHCARELMLESLLFYLEVEVFRELALRNHKEQPDDQLDLGRYACYIYNTYVDVDAPLQVNLSEEVREEVAMFEQYWAGMFDEAQAMVRSIMKHHGYVRFEASDSYARLERLRQNDPERYAAATITKPLSKLFPPTKSLIDGDEGELKLRPSNTSSRHTRFLTNDAEIEQMRRKRERALARALARFKPSPDVASLVPGYFSDETARLTPSQKQRRVQMDRKLTKFFGCHPQLDDVFRQSEAAETAMILKNHRRYSSMGSVSSLNSLLSRQSMASLTSVNTNLSVLSTASRLSRHSHKHSLRRRRRRLRKLEGFFGDPLPEEMVPILSSGVPTSPSVMSDTRVKGDKLVRKHQHRSKGPTAGQFGSIAEDREDEHTLTSASTSGNGDQNEIPDTHARSSAALPPPGPTSNDLDPEARRQLVAQRRKLDKLLGEPLDENMVFDRLVRHRLIHSQDYDCASAVARNAISAGQMERPHSVAGGALNRLLLEDENIAVSSAQSLPTSPRLHSHKSIHTMLSSSEASSSTSLVTAASRVAQADHLHRRSNSFSAPSNILSPAVLTSTTIYADQDAISELMNEEMTPEQRAREIRRKKIEKLFRVLGVHVPVEVLDNAQARSAQKDRYRQSSSSLSTRHRRSFTLDAATEPRVINANFRNSLNNVGVPLTPNEKRAGVRRAEKLERMFGVRPPHEVITSAATSNYVHISSSDSAMGQENDSSTDLASQTTSILDLLELSDDEDDASEDSISLPLNRASLISILMEDDATVDTLLEYLSAPSGVSTPASSNAANVPLPEQANPSLPSKSTRQRRLRKLKRFFGQELHTNELSTQQLGIGEAGTSLDGADKSSNAVPGSPSSGRNNIPAQLEAILRRTQRRSRTLPGLGSSSSGNGNTGNNN